MPKKYKLTGCARFLIFLVIFVPIVYFGVTFFRGENPIEPIKNAIPENWGKDKTTTESSISETAILEGRIKTLEQTNQELREKINKLEEIIESRNQDIMRLRGSN